LHRDRRELSKSQRAAVAATLLPRSVDEHPELLNALEDLLSQFGSD